MSYSTQKHSLVLISRFRPAAHSWMHLTYCWSYITEVYNTWSVWCQTYGCTASLSISRYQTILLDDSDILVWTTCPPSLCSYSCHTLTTVKAVTPSSHGWCPTYSITKIHRASLS